MKLYIFSTSRALHSFLMEQEEGFLPKAMTLGDFFSQAILLKNGTKVPPLLRKIFLADVLKNFDFSQSQKEHLFFEYSFLGFLETSSFLLDFFDELFASQVELSQVAQNDVYGEFEDHLRVIERIYEAYEEKISQNGFCDFVKEFEIFWDFFKGFDGLEFFIDGFLSSFEWKILKELSSRISSVLHVSIDTYNLAQFSNLNPALQVDHFYSISLPNGEIIQSSQRELRSDFSLTSCDFRIDECALVIEKINQWLEEGVDSEKIAVVVPKDDFLTFLEACDEKRNFNFAMGRDSLALSKLLDELKSFEDGLRLEDLRSWLEKRMQKLSSSIRQRIFELLFEYEQYSLYLQSFTFAEILDLFIAEIMQIREEDSCGGKIRVIGMLETRGMSFEKVIVLDFTQENIPSFSNEDMFLNTALRQNLGMPTIQDKQNLQKHFYLELFKNSKEIHLLFAAKKPSFFLYELGLDEVPKKNISTLFAVSEPKIYQEDEIRASIPPNFRLSSSKLNLFASCRRKFYFSYMSDLGEREEEGDSLYLGNLMHQILYESYKDLQDLSLARQRFDTLLAQKQSQIEEKRLAMQIELAALQMREFWKNETDVDAILYLEHPFEFVWEGWEFVGRIDRVDKVGGEIRVIDYKFSNESKRLINPIQSAIYFLYLQSLFPQEKISVYFCALKDGEYKRDEGIEENIEALRALLSELECEKNFEKTKNLAFCHNCIYGILCNR